MRKARINRGIAGVMTLVMVLGQVPTSAIAEAINEPEGVTAEQQQTQGSTSSDNNADNAAGAAAGTDSDNAAADDSQQQNASSAENGAQDGNNASNAANDSANGGAASDATSTQAAPQNSNGIAVQAAHFTLRYLGSDTLSKGTVYDFIKSKFGNHTRYQIQKSGESWNEITDWALLDRDGASNLDLSTSYKVQYYSTSGKIWTWGWKDAGVLSFQRFWNAKFTVNGWDNGGATIDGQDFGNGKTYEINDGASKTFSVKTSEDYEVSVTIDGKPATPNADGSYTIPNNADSAITISYEAVSNATLTIAGDDTFSVKAYGETGRTGQSLTVAAGAEGSIVVTPDGGEHLAVTGITLKDEIAGEEQQLKPTFANHVATVENAPALEKDHEYTLTVTTVQTKVVLNSNVTVNVIQADKDDYAKIVFKALVDGKNCTPKIDKLGDVPTGYEIQYDAGGLSGWKALDFEPNALETFGGAHAFGSQDTEKVRVTYKGNDQYPSVSAEQDINITGVTLKLKDGAEVAARGRKSSEYKQLVFDAAFDAEHSIPSGLTVDDVEIKYLSNTVFGYDVWTDLDKDPGSAGHAFGKNDTETVRFTYKGKPATCTVKIIDGRYKTELSANTNVSIVYNADAATMRAELYDALNPTVTYRNDKGEVAAVPDVSADSFSFEGLKLPADAGEHTGVTVKYEGTLSEGDQRGYQPCSLKDVTVTVTKAPAKVKVTSKKLTYGETVKIADLVSSEPGNEQTKPITVVAGISGDGAGYVSIDLSYYSPAVQQLLNSTLHLDQGISLSDLSDLINNDATMSALESMLKLAGVENPEQIVNGLKTVLGTLTQYGLGASTVSLGGTPSAAGVYVVAAVTASGNYQTAVGMGYLTIAPKTADIKLTWNKELDHKALTYDEGQSFDFGATAWDGDTDITEKANVRVTFAGVTTAGETYLSDEAPRVPGAYTETATVIGGNYFAKPISRAFSISRMETTVTLTGDGFTYNAAPQGPAATVTDSQGNPIGDTTLTYLYSGYTKAGEAYVSTTAPTDAGRYAVIATYAGDAQHATSNKTAWFTIEKATAAISMDDATVTYDGAEHGLTATATIADGTVDVSDQLVVHYSGKDAKPTDAGTYEVVATFPGNGNIEPTSKKATLTIDKASVTIKFEGDDVAAIIYNGAEQGVKASAYWTDAAGKTQDVSDQLAYAYTDAAGKTATPKDAGSYEVKATFPGSKNLAKADAEGSLVINPRQIMASCGDFQKVSGAVDPDYAEKLKVTDRDQETTPWKGDTDIATAAAIKLTDSRKDKDREAPGTYNVNAETANENFEIVGADRALPSKAGTLTVLPRISVADSANGAATAKGEGIVEGKTAEGKTVRGAATGTQLELTATPDDGYKFVGWEITGTTVDDPKAEQTTVTVGSENIEIKAKFELASTPIGPAMLRVRTSVAGGIGGTVSSDPEAAYKGKNVNISAKAEAGWRFDHWEVESGDIKLADEKSADTSFTMGEKSPHIVAHFKQLKVEITIEDGSAIYDGAAHGLKKATATIDDTGEVVTDKLEISYKNTETGETSGTEPTEAGTYEVTATYPGGDGIEPASATATLTISQRPVTVTATVKDSVKVSGAIDPALGYTLTDEAEDKAPWKSEQTVEQILSPTVSRDESEQPGDHAVTASVAQNDNFNVTTEDAKLTIVPSISIDDPQNGTVTLNGEGLISGTTAEGETVRGAATGTQLSLCATAKPGYRFAGWKVEGASVTDPEAEQTTLTVDSENIKVTATFEALPTAPVNVSVKDDEGGTVSVDPAEAYEGQTVTISATANEGYTFDHWAVLSGDTKLADPSAATTTFAMNGSAVHVVAVFKKNATPEPTPEPSDPSKPNGKADGGNGAKGPANAKASATAKGADAKLAGTGDHAAVFAPIAAAGIIIAGIGAALMRRRRQ